MWIRVEKGGLFLMKPGTYIGVRENENGEFFIAAQCCEDGFPLTKTHSQDFLQDCLNFIHKQVAEGFVRIIDLDKWFLDRETFK